MKAKNLFLTILMATIMVSYLKAQDPFLLSPTGNSGEYFKYMTKDYNINGTNYATGLLNLSGYKKITSGTAGTYYNTAAPVQKLQLQGGNILLCRTNYAPGSPDINPTSRNGAILFSDMVTTQNDWIHGKWGIEYDDQYSTGGLNIFNPKSSLTASRKNFNLFIRNDGFVGIGTGTPATMLHVAGEATIASLINDGSNIVTSDATGKLIKVSKNFAGDNLGSHIAERSLNMLDYSIRNSSSGEEFLIRPDNTTTETGLRFNLDNNMILETGSRNTSFSVVGSANGSSSIWVSNYESGGYGFAMNPDNRTGGIYFDANEPQLIMGFKGTQVGIGTIAPTRELDVVGDIALSGAIYGKPSNKASNKLQLWGSSNTDAGNIELGDGSLNWNCVKLIAPGEKGHIEIIAGGKPAVTVRENEVVFGNADLENIIDLKVNGMVYANEVKVTLDRWQDIVFDKDYRLMPLTELSAFVTANKHLPEIPSEKEVLEKGIDIGEMNALLLKKIEELTLYVIEQQKQIEGLKSQIQK
jgi:hypothetical protein